MSDFIITRQANETVNGVRKTGRVFVTGPHFGAGVYSSTEDRDEASRFTHAEATRLVGKHWAYAAPRVEPA